MKFIYLGAILGIACLALVFFTGAPKSETTKESSSTPTTTESSVNLAGSSTKPPNSVVPQSVVDAALARATSKEGTLRDATTQDLESTQQSHFYVESAEATADDFSSNPARSVEEKAVIALTHDYQTPAPQRAAALLGMLDSLPEEIQPEALDGALKLTTDEEFVAQRADLLKKGTTPEMREALMDDILTRTEDARLPSLVEMLDLPLTEAERSDILFVLEAYLDQNFGPNAEDWRIPVRTWVANQTQTMAQN